MICNYSRSLQGRKANIFSCASFDHPMAEILHSFLFLLMGKVEKYLGERRGGGMKEGRGGGMKEGVEV